MATCLWLAIEGPGRQCIYGEAAQALSHRPPGLADRPALPALRLVDEIVWVKMTVNRRMAKSHGFYLQHAKEVCLVARKGADPPGTRQGGVGSDVIFSERRGQSQKPEEIYQLIEELVPNGREG